MPTLNKQKNKNSHRRLNNWLDMLLCWTQIKNIDIQINNNLKEIVEEYRLLITIAEPSLTQQIRIEEILELAVYDTELSKLIDRVEQDIAREIGLFEENVSNSHNSTDKPITSKYENNNYPQNNDDNIVKFPLPPVSHSIQKTSVSKLPFNTFNIPSAILGGAVALLGVYIFNPCSLLGTNYVKEIDSGASSNSKSKSLSILMNASKLYVATHAHGVPKDDVDDKEYIISWEKSLSFEKALPELEQANKKQIREEEQICFETQQGQAKQKQHLGEKRQSLEVGKIWKDETQKSQQKVVWNLEIAPNFRKVANNLSELQNVSFSIGKAACP